MYYRLGIFLLLIIATLGSIVFFTTQTDKPISHKPTVATTIYPLFLIADEIAGDTIDVLAITKPGASPHTFEPNPSTIKALERTEIIFAIGQRLDTWTTVFGQALPNSQIITLDTSVTLLPYRSYNTLVSTETHDHDEYEAHDEHEGIDPHYWLDPNNAQAIAETIAKTFAEIDPEQADQYYQRAQQFSMSLDQFNTSYLSIIKDLSNKKIIVFHNSWQYFANFYGFEIIGVFESAPGQNPTPHQIIALHQLVRANNLNTVFAEPQLATDTINSFVRDANITIAQLDPLGGQANTNSYLALLQYNLDTIIASLK